ncbi:unnamed protein product [Clonostachys solani]|uniref:BolA-like protein n=1 Tax=Clonostachys solani TaxID=160281 RepID=A0A9N9VT03_9HYPO|nr:unnamed protein product [Clonostachys solani]
MAQITDASLRETITERLQAIHVEVTDMSGISTVLSSILITNKVRFQGLNSLKRHRLVNSALKEEIASIHAWTAKCKTPEEWERDRGQDAPSLEGTVGGQVQGTAQ